MPENDKVFVDSNFWVAIFNPADSLHQSAIAKSKKIKKENPRLFISNYIFLETVTVLSQRVNRKAAVMMGKKLLEDNQVEIVHIHEALNSKPWEIFQKVKNKNVSLVDCSIIAVMKYENIKKLLTFDRQDFSVLRKKYKFSWY